MASNDINLSTAITEYEKLRQHHNWTIQFIQSWILTLNSGAVVAILTYIATTGKKPALIIIALVIFCIGIITGMTWAIINFFSARTYTKAFETYIKELLRGEKNKDFQLPKSISIYDKLIWGFSILSGISILGGFGFGLYSLWNY